jgi:hypothetical protein
MKLTRRMIDFLKETVFFPDLIIVLESFLCFETFRGRGKDLSILFSLPAAD